MGDEKAVRIRPILLHKALTSSYNIKSQQYAESSCWFPIYASPKLAEVVAALMTDGHIDWNTCDDNPRPKKIILYSNYTFECQWFLDRIHTLFGSTGKIIGYVSSTGFSKNTSYKAIVYNAPLARLLILLGVPCGDKTLRSYHVPDWIMDSPKEIKSAFLRALFTFDGGLSVRQLRSGAEINFCFNKHKTFTRSGIKFMRQIRSLLCEFGIMAGKLHIRRTIYKKYPNYDKNTFMLFISNHTSIINFYNYVDFLDGPKQNRLRDFIYKIYKHARVPPHPFSSLFFELKKRFGTDEKCTAVINEYSIIPFTCRQFEHIKRGEGRVPLQMLLAMVKILNKKNIIEKIPIHYQTVVNICDRSSLQ